MSDTRRAPEASSADVGPVGSVSRPSFKRTLTFFGFFAITASMVMTVYEYPSFASSGFQLVFFLIIGGILGAAAVIPYKLSKKVYDGIVEELEEKRVLDEENTESEE